MSSIQCFTDDNPWYVQNPDDTMIEWRLSKNFKQLNTCFINQS